MVIAVRAAALPALETRQRKLYMGLMGLLLVVQAGLCAAALPACTGIFPSARPPWRLASELA